MRLQVDFQARDFNPFFTTVDRCSKADLLTTGLNVPLLSVININTPWITEDIKRDRANSLIFEAKKDMPSNILTTTYPQKSYGANWCVKERIPLQEIYLPRKPTLTILINSSVMVIVSYLTQTSSDLLLNHSCRPRSCKFQLSPHQHPRSLPQNIRNPHECYRSRRHSNLFHKAPLSLYPISP